MKTPYFMSNNWPIKRPPNGLVESTRDSISVDGQRSARPCQVWAEIRFNSPSITSLMDKRLPDPRPNGQFRLASLFIAAG
jgi:hypothetical protein